MTPLVPALVATCFAFATGIFYVLSCVEKPVWRLMTKPLDPSVPDATARLVHAELKRVIHLLPPTMMTAMASGAVLLLVQAWLRGFEWASLTVLGVFILGMGYVVSMLRARIKAVDDVPSEAEIATVRIGLGRLAALHHMGLVTVALVAVLQLALVIGLQG